MSAFDQELAAITPPDKQDRCDAMQNQRLPTGDLEGIAEASSASTGFLPKMAGLAIVSFILLLAVAYLFHIADRPVTRHVPAEPYVWPSGCKPTAASNDWGHPGVRYYRAADEIPKACMDPQYYIAHPGKYGLVLSKYRKTRLFEQYGGGREYYRVGPDAVEIFCLDDGRCFIDHVEKDVFSDAVNSQEPVPQNPLAREQG